MSAALFEALGAENETQALRIVAEANQFLADIKAITKFERFDASTAAMRGAFALAREIEKVTEKPTSEAIGVVMAWKASADQLGPMAARSAELEETLRSRDVDALIEKGLQTPGPGCSEFAGKLTPATAGFWKSKTAEEVKAYLAIAPRVIPMMLKPVEQPTASAGAAADANGQRWEDMKPTVLAALKKTDPTLHGALRSDWVARGKPSASAPAQGASH